VNERDIGTRSFPAALLLVAVALSLTAILGLGWSLYQAASVTEASRERAALFESLRGDIIHMDEVLTMSAPMAAATGDLRWEQRYRQYEQKLDATIRKTLELTPGSGAPAATTFAANEQLVAMENRGFDLVRGGRTAEAQEVLSSEAYEKQKRRYAQGVSDFIHQARESLDAQLRRERRNAAVWIGTAAAALMISSGIWLLAFLRVREWRAALVRGIEERERAERALRETEQDLVTAQRITQVGFWRRDLVTEESRWSDEAFRILGLARGEMSPSYQAILNAVHPEDRAQVERKLEQVIRERRASSLEFRIVRRDGTVRHLVGTGELIGDASGTPMILRGTIQDVTERRQAEEQLRQAQKMEVVGQLTGGVAHDFNNLLAVMAGNLELLSEGVPEDSPLRDCIDAALHASGRGAELTQRLLAFSRRQALAPVRTDLNELVREMDGLLRRTLGETIQIETLLAEDLWESRIDRNQLENALLNLTVNARDAMPGGGKLTVETANVVIDQGRAQQLEDADPGPYVMLSVRDTGSGIPADLLPKVFEPFFTTKQVGRGSGLGLSMVYGFVKQSGGHVELASGRNAGTTFELYLPKAQGAASHRANEPASEREPSGRGELVLVVEDDAKVRVMVSRLLAGLGYRVVDVRDAREAEARIAEEPSIDLLLTDVVLPGGMSGPAFAAVARERRPDLRVVYMSGYAENAFGPNGILDDSDRLISKPFRRAELARTVREALDDERPAGHL